ncbi:hypothetical protein BOTNAR_0263g00010 [Botryotinia narcissicola]|uniref:Uncharacterized protein n=1 Tax=Botryotinia narcissicola TaxID=278944 RepID=A0A4Z1ICS0_9HELO|nr:hypothetical protein BOTNAR_0263g00010 [Botryotinia narcissicola]
MMFKESSFLPILLGATLVSAVPTQIVKRTTPIIANFEDITFSDFASTYKCLSGQVNSEVTGQCIPAVTPRSITELVVRTSGELRQTTCCHIIHSHTFLTPSHFLYEIIPIGGIPPLSSNAPLTFYNQLTYGGTWRAILKTGAAALLQQIYGQQAAVGFNGSTITSVYLASPVASFKANYASFACYISTTTGVSPGVACTVQVTAFKTDGSTYEDVAGCGYDGLGLFDFFLSIRVFTQEVEQCTFPSTWTNVAKLSFQIVASEILQEVGPSLGGLLGGLLGTVGSIGFIVDNFDANYNCVAGKTNSVVAPGLCG